MSNRYKTGAKWIRRSKRLAIYLRDNFCCVYCLRNLRMASRHYITLDHVDNSLYFGTPDNSETNLVTCCLPCNRNKHDQLLQQWADVQTMARVAEATAKPLPRTMALAILRGEVSPPHCRLEWLKRKKRKGS